MAITTTQPAPALQRSANRILHELGIPVHRIGYKQLCLAIVHYSQHDIQSLSKELYPAVAAHFGYTDWHPVEHAIRLVICQAWSIRDAELWEQYFTNPVKPPSNKQFIATIAELI